MYALVVFENGSTSRTAEIDQRHERFIDSLIRRNVILLGGGFSMPAGPFAAAYLLHCESLEDADQIVSTDPYVRTGLYKPTVVGWDLVGVNPDAIDEATILTASDL